MKRPQTLSLALLRAWPAFIASAFTLWGADDLSGANGLSFSVPGPIRAFCVDFNWGPGGPNGFAPPGLWADADPVQHVKWYAGLGVNVLQTFAVSCNGYAWYQGGKIPAQPGLKHDFLPGLVRLGHERGMLVMGYFCIAANTRWGLEHPDLSYGTPSTYHLPLTDAYLDYLALAIEEALRKSDMDGFMVDWLWNPSEEARQAATRGQWLEAEQQLYTRLTGKPFPSDGTPSAGDRLLYERKAIDRCWRRLHDTAKRVKPNCVLWLSCNDVRSPQLVDTSVLKEADWMMDESGTPQAMQAVASRLGNHTRQMLCLVGWGDRHDARKVLTETANAGYGIYGFSKPGENSLPRPIEEYLGKAMGAFTGNDRNLAALARWFNGLSFEAVLPRAKTGAQEPMPPRAWPTPPEIPIAPGPFQPTWDSLKQYRYPDWFRDAKFGIWAVWGVCSVGEQGDWYSRNLYVQGHKQYDHHLAKYGHPSKSGYKDLIPLWKAERWDPDHLMELYARAGAKYFCSLAVFCDNTDYWDSKYHRWNSVQVGPHRDIAGEWARAARKHGLRFGVTEHLGNWWNWLDTSKQSDKTGPLAGVPYDGNDPRYADLYCTTANPADWLVRMKDLVDRYQPDLFYTDGGLPWPERVGREFLAHYYNQNLASHGGKLEAVYTCKQNSQGLWVEDLERGIMGEIRQYPWQTDTCVGDWHYLESLQQQHHYRSTTLILQMLADVVSKNGNLLLNFPPRPDGSLDDDELKILDELAAWMPANGEAIFGTRPWKVFGEGPARVQSGGFNEGRLQYTEKDIRYTTKGETLYALALGWPESGTLLLRRLATPAGKVEQVNLLGSGEKLSWAQQDDGLVVSLPRQKPGQHVFALKITGHALTPANQ